MDEQVQDVVEETPVESAEETPTPEETTPEGTVEQIVEEPVESPTPESPPQFNLPGVQPAVDETAYLRQQLAQSLNQNAQYRQQLEQQELSGLDEHERQIETMRRENARMKEQVQGWQQQQDVLAWRNSFANVPLSDPGQLSTMSDPNDMVGYAINDLISQRHQRDQEIADLKSKISVLEKAAGTPQPGPKVTTGGAGNTVRRSAVDIPRAQREDIYRRMRMGLPVDIPGVN